MLKHGAYILLPLIYIVAVIIQVGSGAAYYTAPCKGRHGVVVVCGGKEDGIGRGIFLYKLGCFHFAF